MGHLGFNYKRNSGGETCKDIPSVLADIFPLHQLKLLRSPEELKLLRSLQLYLCAAAQPSVHFSPTVTLLLATTWRCAACSDRQTGKPFCHKISFPLVK